MFHAINAYKLGKIVQLFFYGNINNRAACVICVYLFEHILLEIINEDKSLLLVLKQFIYIFIY